MSEQIQELQEGWTWAQLSDVTQRVPNAKPINEPEREFGYVDISSICNKSFRITDLKRFKGKKAPSRAKRPIQPNDVLFSNVRTYLKNVAIVTEDIDADLCSTGFTLLRSNGAALPEYIFHFILTDGFINTVTPKQTGSEYPATSDRVVLSSNIPLPPLAEQKRIVAKVEELFARINAAREHLNRIPSILKRFRQSVLAAACSGKLTEDWRERKKPIISPEKLLQNLIRGRHVYYKNNYPNKKIKEPAQPERLFRFDIPDEWIITSVDQISLFVTDGDHNPPKRVSHGIPHLTAKNVKNGKLSLEGCTYISQADYARVRRRYEPNPNDIIVTCVGTLGATAVIPEKNIFSADRNLAVIRPMSGMNPHFIQLVIDSPIFQKRITEASGSTAQPHLYLSDLRVLDFPLPPIEEQQVIVDRVENLFTIIHSIEQRANSSKNQVDVLGHAVLKQAFSGNLVVNETDLAREENRNYETAEVLLARIKAERKAAEPKKKTRKTGRKKKKEPLEEAKQEAAPSKAVEHEETKKPASKKKPSRKEYIFDTDEVMRLFRTSCRGTGEISEDDLLREVVYQLDYQRLTKGIKQELKGHLKTAIRRNILERDGSILKASTPRFNDYEDDFLRNTLKSVMRKGYEYDRDEVTKAIAAYLGFSTASQSISTRMKSIYNSAIRRGMIEGKGQIVWRIK